MSGRNRDGAVEDYGALDAIVDSILSRGGVGGEGGGEGGRSLPQQKTANEAAITRHHDVAVNASTSATRDDDVRQDALSIDQFVERILERGSDGQREGRRQPRLSSPPPPSSMTDAPTADGSTPNPIRGRPSASSQVKARKSQPRSGSNSRYSLHREEEEAMLRRFALWDERKSAKKLKAVYEALLAEAAECTFQPCRTPDALLGQKVFAGAAATGKAADACSSERPRQRGGMERSGRGSSSEGNSRVHDTRNAPYEDVCSAATWDSLLAPSPLYANNKAWGFDEYVARMAAARQEKERLWQQEEEAIRRLCDPQTFVRAPTKPEPFELSCYSKPSPLKQAVAAGASATFMSTSSPNERSRSGRYSASGKRAAGWGSDADVAGGEDDDDDDVERSRSGRGAVRRASPLLRWQKAEMDTFSSIGPAIRKHLLFADDTTEQLERATSAIRESLRE